MARSKPNPAYIRSLLLPESPMAPISSPVLPLGGDWGYQLKWDGVRMLAHVYNAEHIELFSRNLLPKNQVFPEIVHMLRLLAPKLGRCVLDGEVVWWNGTRADFQQVLKRERSRGAEQADQSKTTGPLLSFIQLPGTTHSRTFSPVNAEHDTAHLPYGGALIFVLFDLLYFESKDLRPLPYTQRHRKLMELIPPGHDRIFVTDLFEDGSALWNWVENHSWEGVVSKRLSSPYREDKKHSDWYKKKTALLVDVDIVGFKWRSGRIASLIMAYKGSYFGSVSLGLTDELRRALAAAFPPAPITSRNAASAASATSSASSTIACPFPSLPVDLKRELVQWLPYSFRCRVTGLQITDAGQLRHPKLVTFLPKETTS